MKKLSIQTSLVLAVMLNPISSATPCGEVTSVKGGTCEKLAVQFDLGGCGDESAEVRSVSSCKEGKAIFQFATSKHRYKATLAKSDGGWGESTWKVESFDKRPVAQVKKTETEPAVETHVVEAKPVEAPVTREVASPQVVDLSPVTPAEEEVGVGRLLGNAGNFRKRLANSGLSLSPNYTGEYSKVLGGGVDQQSTYMGKMNLILDADLEKTIGAKGWLAHVILMGTHGVGPSRYAGDSQASSNIEAPATVRLYEAYLQKSFAEGSVSILGGLYDLNSEFYVTPTSLAFLNSSFGVGKELSQAAYSAGNQPSIFPIPSFGGRLKVAPNPNFYFQTAITDGVPGDPDDVYGTHVLLNKDDGLFVDMEAGYQVEGDLPGKYALGYWNYTQAYDSIQPFSGGIEKRMSNGYYALLDQTIAPSFSAFFRFGMAAKDVNRFAYNLSGGLVYTGVVSAFKSDAVGFGITSAINGGDYMESQDAAGTPASKSETAYEFFYRFEPVSGFFIQPDYQLIVHPNTDPLLENASVFALRFDILF